MKRKNSMYIVYISSPVFITILYLSLNLCSFAWFLNMHRIRILCQSSIVRNITSVDCSVINLLFRFYLILPLHSSMSDPSLAREFQLPFAEALVTMRGNPSKVGTGHHSVWHAAVLLLRPYAYSG